MTIFSGLFLLFTWALVFWDWTFHGREFRRVVYVLIAMAIGVTWIVFFPGPVEQFREFVGVGRVVDLVLYVVVAWLFREFLYHRAYRRKLDARLTAIVRELAVHSARVVGPAEPIVETCDRDV